MLATVKRTYWNKVIVVANCWFFLVVLWVASAWPYHEQKGTTGYEDVAGAISTLADVRICMFQIVSVFVILGIAAGFRKKTSAASFEQTIAMYFDEACSFTLNFAVVFLLSGIATLIRSDYKITTVVTAFGGSLANLLFSAWAWQNATPSEN